MMPPCTAAMALPSPWSVRNTRLQPLLLLHHLMLQLCRGDELIVACAVYRCWCNIQRPSKVMRLPQSSLLERTRPWTFSVGRCFVKQEELVARIASAMKADQIPSVSAITSWVTCCLSIVMHQNVQRMDNVGFFSVSDVHFVSQGGANPRVDGRGRGVFVSP